MEENLKTIRGLHRLIVAASTVLLIYALSTKVQVNKYELALQEFQYLDSCINTLVKFQDSVALDVYGDYFEELEVYERKYIDTTLIDKAEEKDAPIVRISNDFGLHKIAKGPLSKQLEFFSSPNNWLLMGPYLDDNGTPYHIESFIAKLDSNLAEAEQLTGILVTIYDDSVVAKGYIYYTDAITDIEFRGRMDQGPIYHWDLAWFEYDGSNPLKERIRTFEYVEELSENAYITFPTLREMYHTMKDVDYAYLTGFLTQKSMETEESNRKYLEISGVKLPTELIAFGGPLIIFFILIDLVSQVIHLNSIKKDGLDSIRNFPWLGTIPDKMNFYLTVSSIALLVPIACIMPIIRSNYSEMSKWIISLLFVVMIEFIAFKFSRHLLSIRNAVNSSFKDTTI